RRNFASSGQSLLRDKQDERSYRVCRATNRKIGGLPIGVKLERSTQNSLSHTRRWRNRDSKPRSLSRPIGKASSNGTVSKSVLLRGTEGSNSSASSAES